MEEFLELFGHYEVLGLTVYKWFLVFGATIFGVKILRKAWKLLKATYEEYKERQERLQEALSQVSKYPTWHQQSIDIRTELSNELKKLAQNTEENTRRLSEFEEEIKNRDRNKLKSELLKWFHYYTNSAKNPQHAWIEMEADVFWSSFSDYEDLDGNGFMHSDVQPAMNQLEVIKMDDPERVMDLYASRKT